MAKLAGMRNHRSNFEQWTNAAKLFKLENATAAACISFMLNMFTIGANYQRRNHKAKGQRFIPGLGARKQRTLFLTFNVLRREVHHTHLLQLFPEF